MGSRVSDQCGQALLLHLRGYLRLPRVALIVTLPSRVSSKALIDRMAYIEPRLRELQIIPYHGHTYA